MDILQGIRVIDFSLWGVGPMAAMMLADLGAEVIHVEQPGVGDPMRGFTSMFDADMRLPGGRVVLFEALNRNKKSITVDLKRHEGKGIIYKLVSKSDVFMTNYRNATIAKLEIDYETLSQHNPRLIYASSTGFGEVGEMKDIGSFDLAGLAMSGMMFVGDYPDAPIMINSGTSDDMTSIMMAYGTVAALLARERLGIGQKLSTSHLGTALYNSIVALSVSLFTDLQYSQARTKAGNPMYNWYKCKDGRWLALLIVQGDRYWSDFCDVLGIKHLEKDPRFVNAERRKENCEELIATLDKMFATKPYEEWAKALHEKDLGACPILKISEAKTHQQVLENEYVVEFEHPVLGRIPMVGQPIKYSKTPASLRMPAPECGQHTEEVLLDVLGYSWEEIEKLKDRGII